MVKKEIYEVEEKINGWELFEIISQLERKLYFMLFEEKLSLIKYIIHCAMGFDDDLEKIEIHGKDIYGDKYCYVIR